jgi:hypothetical protein
MSNFHVRRPSPALVVAMIALIVALGGTSYAAFSLPAGTVGSRQLKNGSVGALKLKNGAVTASKIGRRAITAAALNPALLGTVPSATNAKHAITADGAAPTGAARGDLTGSYPNPSIGPGAVTPAKIGTIPQVSATNSATQSIADGTVTDLAFDTNEFDTAGLHSTTTNTSRLTAPIAGVYEVNLSGRWSPSATGDRFLAIEKNGRGYSASTRIGAAPGGATTDQSISTLIKLGAGEFVSAVAYQASGAALTIGNMGGDPTRFSMSWVGSG